MNQTGVTSTGSRRQAFRNRLKAYVDDLGLLIGPAKQLARKRDELFEPQRLVPQLRPELPNFIRLGIVQVVVTRHDCDRSLCESRNRTDGAKELKTARQRHPQVENDRVR